MKLDVKAMAFTIGLVWGAAMLLTGVAYVISGGYGEAFLDVMASVYPGYQATSNFGDVIVGTLYGLVDGAVGGAVIAWLYNRLAGRGSAWMAVSLTPAAFQIELRLPQLDFVPLPRPCGAPTRHRSPGPLC